MDKTAEHIEARAPIFPIMSAAEIALLKASLLSARNYLEFGAGGSTIIASEMGVQNIHSVESHKGWADYVLADPRLAVRPKHQKLTIHCVDIGPVKQAGYPVDDLSQCKWPNYYSSVWNILNPFDLDIVLVDGRFRIACGLAAIERCRSNVSILVHDWDRTHYHKLLQVADVVSLLDKLVILRPKPTLDRRVLQELQASVRKDPH